MMRVVGVACVASVAFGLDMPPTPKPDREVGLIVDGVARRFVEANGRGFEGWEPKLLKEAARNYHAKITPLAMPWPVDHDSAESFEIPAGVAPKVPNLAHWAWRSGDADWTMALSVVMAKVVQRTDTMYLHTGPLGEGDWSYTTPRTEAGKEALRCIEAAGATEFAHAVDPTPDPDGRHPWAEVMRNNKPGHAFSKQTFAHISDVMRLYTILKHGGIYLDRDAFLHKKVDHYRWKYDAVLGLEMQNFERDHAANFGCIMAAPNSSYFQYFWDGKGEADYVDLSYRVTWGGWAHDSCRKSYALAIKRPDLVHMEARLLQYPFPGHGPARGNKVSDELLALTQKSEVCHMSGFKWHGGREAQLRMTPSIWGQVMWPNVLAAAAEEPRLDDDLLTCVTWLGEKLVNESYMPAAANAAPWKKG